MSGPHGDKPIPRPVLIGAGTLLLLVVILAGVARYTGYRLGVAPQANALVSRDVAFVDQPDGSIAVEDPATHARIDLLEPGTYGFVRGATRALAREHRGLAQGGAAPFRLTRWDDGRVTLQDLTTGTRIELEAYGPTNLEAFTRLLTVGKPAS
ncbi:MAG: hypothetical protein RLZZ501_1521 [Pseudomonadota bacterium]|jgi:putative photosynthetic complex assembly protein